MTSRARSAYIAGHVTRARRAVRQARLECEALRVDDGTAADLYQLEVMLMGIAGDLQCNPPRRSGLARWMVALD